MNKKFLIVIHLFVVVLFTFEANAKKYYTVPEVLTYFFKTSEEVNSKSFTLTDADLQKIYRLVHKSKSFPLRDKWTVYVAKTGNKIDGYALIDNIIGRDRPITYAVKISPKGEIQEIEILVYRESHGGQVKQAAFRRQFVSKKIEDPIRVGRDIKKVSGATISSRNVAYGVKRVLAVWNVMVKSK